MHHSCTRLILSASMFFAAAAAVQAQQAAPITPDRSNAELFTAGNQPILTLAQATPKKDDKAAAKPAAEAKKPAAGEDLYREVSDFFNIREANANTKKGGFSFEVGGVWTTESNGHHDDFGLAESLKYGITDDLFAEIEVTQNSLTNGDNTGAGDIHLILFNRFLKESGGMPALAGWAEMRIPTGDGSRGVDGTFHGTVTKSITDKFRLNLDGYVATLNGGSGHDDDRKHFAWGIGPGVDYMLSDATMLIANYVNRSSEEDGGHNQNILEFGMTQRIAQSGSTEQFIKLAADVGLDGADTTPNFAIKLLWELEWK